MSKSTSMRRLSSSRSTSSRSTSIRSFSSSSTRARIILPFWTSALPCSLSTSCWRREASLKMLGRWLKASRMRGAVQQKRTHCRSSRLFSFTRERLATHSWSTEAISRQSCTLSRLASSRQNCSLLAKLDSIRNLLNSFSRQDLSIDSSSTRSSPRNSSQASRSRRRRLTANSKMMYLRQRDSLQSARSSPVRFEPVGRMLRPLKLHLRMQSTPRMRYPTMSTMKAFSSQNCSRIFSRSTASCLAASASASASSFPSDFTEAAPLELSRLSVVTSSGSQLSFLNLITDSKAFMRCSYSIWYPVDCFSSDSSGTVMNLKGSVNARKSLSSARDTRVLLLRSIILSRNLRKFSRRSEEEPMIFMSWESGLSRASSRAARYSLQLAVFFLRQGWKPKMTSQMQVPSEQISLFSLGRKVRDFSFSGGMQEIVPLRVVVALHSTPTSETPKSHSLKLRPFFSTLAGLMSSCTIPASSRVISPLETWKNRSQISSSVSGPSPRCRRKLMSVPDSQYSWKMQRLFSDSRCSRCVLTRLGQSGRLWMMRSSLRYSLRTSSDSMRITFTANVLPWSLRLTALQTLAQRPSPSGCGISRYLSSMPVCSFCRVTTFGLSYIVLWKYNIARQLRNISSPRFLENRLASIKTLINHLPLNLD